VGSSESLRVNAPQVVGEVIDGEAVIVNLERGTYYSLNGPGGLVWSCIERRLARSEIVAAVRLGYAGVPAEIEADVLRLLGELEAEGLAVPAEASAPAGPPPAAPADGREPAPYEPPALVRYDDMRDLLLLDPIHEVDEMGWPNVKPAADPST
jgi:hypothetical protein